ncbi:MAG TPA: hypothetical protein VK705_12030, partial [Ferruginibacter sp.]|nr:hypothetical protein [Ferruginibacter sp.]
LEQAFKFNDFLDSVIVWIVGLSTGAIFLIVSNNDKISFIPKSEIAFILKRLAYSILFGVIGRILYTIAWRIGLILYITFTSKLSRGKLINNLDSLPENSHASNEKSVDDALHEIYDMTIKSWGFRKDKFDNIKEKDNRVIGIINRLLGYTSYILYTVSAGYFIYAIFYFIAQYSK